MYHLDFQCQMIPNGIISQEPNKFFPVSIRQEDFPVMEFKSSIVDFHLLELGMSKISGWRILFFMGKN